MKKYLLLMLVVLTGIVSSCKYDDDELWGSVDDLANRVSALETLTKQMNGDISALQAIVTAVQNQVAVSEVEKLTDGYILHFTNGTTATIKNGTDGKDGANGENGADGEDGKDGADGKDGKDAPAIGVAKDGDVYYWTITIDGETDWLTDDAGNKLPVTGEAGADGEDGKDAASGSTGAAGKDGITPLLKIDATTGEWLVSYDNGTTYKKVEGSANAKPTHGTDGVALFESVDPTDETVTITMKNGNVYVIPLLKSLMFYDAENNPVDIKNIKWNGETSFLFTYTLELDNAAYEVYDESGVKVDDVSEKTVKLSLESNAVSDARAVVLFYNESQTLTAVFKFKVAPWDGETASDELIKLEDEGEGTVLGIATPADLKLFANIVNGKAQTYGGRAAEEEPAYKLLNDIDLSNFPWEPIGLTRESAFKGTFDGNGKTIKGLKVVNIGTDESGITTGAGLFGVVEDATVKGLTVTDAKVELTDDGVEAAGLIVGRAYGDVTLENIIVEREINEGTDVQGAQKVGSIAGYIESSNVTIKGCEVKSANLDASTTTSSGDKVTVGGVVGTLKVVGESGTATLNIEGNKVGGVDLSTSADSDTSAGGVIGALEMEDNVTIEKNIKDNVVSDAKTEAPSADESTATHTQGPIIGNMVELAPEISAEILKDNNVSEDVQIETQLTVDNLETVLQSALKDNATNSFNVKGNISESKEITIPTEGVDVTLNFDALATTPANVLTIKQGTGTSAIVSSHKLIVNVPTTDAGQYLNIQAPETTVTLASGHYAKVTALTAQNTLVVAEEVTIQDLTVVDGSVLVYGHVVNLNRSSQSTGEVTVTIKDNGRVDNMGEGFFVMEGNPGEQEFALKMAAKNGGTFVVTERIRLTSPLIVEKNLTLDFNGGAFDGDIGQFVDSKGWKAMVVVKPGATFVYNNGGEFNTGHMETQLTCIRMVGGSEALSKVIINNGSLIGTYHAILIDEDCQNAEVEINGGSLSCDWYKNFNGSAILNKSNAKVSITGGHVSSCASAVEMWGGQFTMTNGTLESSYQGENSYVDTEGKPDNCIVGSALALYPAANQTITATISKGTFQGLSSIYEIGAGDNTTVNLTITDGTFEGAINSQNCQGFISGGKFKVQPDVKFVVEGKAAVKDGEYYSIMSSVEGGNANGGNFGNGGVF